MWLWRSHFQYLRPAFVAAVLLCVVLPVQAQEAAAQGSPATPAAAPAKPKKPYGGGSPLDVLLHTKLWETPPPLKPWVKANRLPQSSLRFQPTAKVVDPARPKTLTQNQLKSLEDELDQAGARNERAAGVKDKDFAGVVLTKAGKSKRRKSRAEKRKTQAPLALHPR